MVTNVSQVRRRRCVGGPRRARCPSGGVRRRRCRSRHRPPRVQLNEVSRLARQSARKCSNSSSEDHTSARSSAMSVTGRACWSRAKCSRAAAASVAGCSLTATQLTAEASVPRGGRQAVLRLARRLCGFGAGMVGGEDARGRRREAWSVPAVFSGPIESTTRACLPEGPGVVVGGSRPGRSRRERRAELVPGQDRPARCSAGCGGPQRRRAQLGLGADADLAVDVGEVGLHRPR